MSWRTGSACEPGDWPLVSRAAGLDRPVRPAGGLGRHRACVLRALAVLAAWAVPRRGPRARTLQVRAVDGAPVLHHPATPWGDPADLARGCGRGVSAETLPPDTVTARMDLGYIVNVLMTQAA